MYDWISLVEDNADGLWLFLKWMAIDLVYLFGLPELRIPWLEFSQPVVILAYAAHFSFTWMLMFNVNLPLTSWLLGFAKVFYDREIGIMEHNVKVSNILHNSSLISGRQIINILPEGSAVLNPKGTPFCLGGDNTVAYVPLQFNATIPIDVEILRIDLETGTEELLKMAKSGIKEVTKMAKRQEKEDESVVTYNFPIKKAGAYRLGKVLDEYKLEVQRTTPDTFVVNCPSARVAQAKSSTRCVGELSDLAFQVAGTPPLKIVYSRTTNGKDHSFHFQSLQPDGFSSPLLGARPADHDEGDVLWARSQHVTVSINESMTTTGSWRYVIDEVHDAFGNIVKYTSDPEDMDMVPKPRAKHLVQDFIVRERPRAKLSGCDIRNPIKVAKGKSAALPISFNINGGASADTAHTITWDFSPIDTLTKNSDHGEVVFTESYVAKNSHDRPIVTKPGLYTLKTVTCASCEGEIQEPSSCLLINPLEPKLTLKAEDIPDKCAGNSIGLRVDMDLVGTPPFIVRYDVLSDNKVRKEKVQIPGLRHQMDLLPKSAGKHSYVFKQIDDSIYKGQALFGDDMVLETDVKPAATAYISHPTGKISACLEEQVEVDVLLLGDSPFTLEYELIHDGRRKQEKVTGIEEGEYKIKTIPLMQGGDYNLALTSITDKSGCRRFLKDEVKLFVRRQRPRASFGLIENKRKVMAIADSNVKLPIRLTGEGPWTVSYRNLEYPSIIHERRLTSNNDNLNAKERGEYEIVGIYDNQCHGTVDPKASNFHVDWFPRPELSLIRTESISERGSGFAKQDICEGDIDGFDVMLKGSPPYHVEYEIRHKPVKKSGESISRKSFDAALGKASIQMDTSKAGTYTYKFSALADNLYNSNNDFSPLVLQQKVNPRPSASFAKPGQSFKYCMVEQENEDTIPISLTGQAPFSIDIEVKHHSGTQPETYTIPVIETNMYGLKIPRKYLKLGAQQVRIKSVRDANGCQSKINHSSMGQSVQVQLFDAPAIYPLETRTDYCVGDRIAYSLSGTPPFQVNYRFGDRLNRAKVSSTTFKRIAEAPGPMTIESVTDRASECRADYNMTKTIHPMPSVRISRGRNARVDIHEGSEVEILFEFWGTPPFEFTYTRSTNARKGQRSVVLETRHDISYEHEKRVMASQEGTYEVVAIKDHYCAYSTLISPDGNKGR